MRYVVIMKKPSVEKQGIYPTMEAAERRKKALEKMCKGFIFTIKPENEVKKYMEELKNEDNKILQKNIL